MGDHVRAFDHYRRGAAHKRSLIVYEEDKALDLFRRTAETFDAEVFRRYAGMGVTGRAPIFIVGMPRSGSTLVEQIMASHPMVYAAGELKVVDKIIREMVSPDAAPFHGFPAALNPEFLKCLGQAYLAGAPPEAKGRRITDKMPFNFFFLGVIRLMLPDAKIIHTMRDPIDTCVSIFTTLFTEGNEFSYDLTELAHFYRGYSDLMAHWRAVLPAGFMLDVRYEDVVADLEGQARRLLDHCGLPWDDRCLAFHRNERPIKTASYAQVRKPIYRNAIGRWRRYGEALEPLLRGLGAGE